MQFLSYILHVFKSILSSTINFAEKDLTCIELLSISCFCALLSYPQLKIKHTPFSILYESGSGLRLYLHMKSCKRDEEECLMCKDKLDQK